MKTKFLLAVTLILALSIGGAYAGTMKAETNKTVTSINAKMPVHHWHHHRHHHHHMMHH